VNNTTEHTVSAQEFVSKKEYDKALQEITLLKHQISEMKRLIFGSKSERFIPLGSLDSEQLSLFDIPSSSEASPPSEEIHYTRKKHIKEKAYPVRTEIPEHLPRVEEVLEPDINLVEYKKIGEKVTEVLEYNPGHIFVRKIVRPQYIKSDTERIVIAELPSLPIPKGNAGASLLAYLLVSKYADHIPFDRLRKILKRCGAQISKSTINGWFNKSTALLELLYEELEKQLLQTDYLQADESPIKVQDPNKKGALHRGYQWVYRSPVQNLVLFKYNKSRGKEVPKLTLNHFNGALQTDGYAGYQHMQTNGNITLLACMAHARRKFKEALDMDAKRAGFVLSKMQSLYEIERLARERQVDCETLKRFRQLYAKPILEEIEQWLKTNLNQVVPQSAIGKAISYTYNLWPRLKRYMDDGRYEIDNNLIENAIRPLALGRKNYLFAGSHEAAQKAAIMYSLFASCKINNVDPLKWLTNVFNRISDSKVTALANLLPNKWKVPTE